LRPVPLRPAHFAVFSGPAATLAEKYLDLFAGNLTFSPSLAAERIFPQVPTAPEQKLLLITNPKNHIYD